MQRSTWRLQMASDDLERTSDLATAAYRDPQYESYEGAASNCHLKLTRSAGLRNARG